MIAGDLFVDAGAWVAITDTRDNYHSVAIGIYPELLRTYRHLVTTNLVVSEVYALVLARGNHRAAIQFLENLRSSPRIERVLSTSNLETAAERILRRYGDHDFSFVDAVSFALMQERKIREAFTFDHHFEILGFNCLPNE